MELSLFNFRNLQILMIEFQFTKKIKKGMKSLNFGIFTTLLGKLSHKFLADHTQNKQGNLQAI